MTDTTTHDFALARAERDAWQTTCEELHHQIARLTVEAETYRNDIDAADQRVRTIDAALAHEREAGRGLVAQVEALRAESRHHAAIAAQNATVAADELCAAIGRAEKAERRLAALESDAIAGVDATIAKLRAEVAELRARPEVPAEHGPITLPSPDAAQELADTYIDEFHRKPGHHKTFDHAVTMERRAAMRRALAKLSPAPAREAAPTLVAVSDEELMHEFYTGAENGTRPVNGIRAVRAKLGAAEVTEERVKAALKLVDGITSSDDLTDDESLDERATFFVAHLRATAAKGG